MQGAASVTTGGAPGGFASIVPHRPRARPGVPRAPAGPGAFGRASRSAGSTTSIHGHRDRHRRESWDMGPLGGCSGLPGLRQTFPRPGGADPGYVEHRPVSGAGVRKLVAARYARFREFAPLRLARPTPAGTVQAAIFGKCVATFRVPPDDSIYVYPATWSRHGQGRQRRRVGMILPASRRGT